MSKLKKHKNPNPNYAARIATAPYNFVPLPDRIVEVTDDSEHGLPSHDRFYPDTGEERRHTGYFEVGLTTRSPLYVRGGLSTKRTNGQASEFEKAEAQKYAGEAPRFREAVKNKPDFFSVADSQKPVIPGSSLRGMLRQLLEVVSYGKISRVNHTLRIFYRAVADESDDSLKTAYEEALGKLGKKIKAGYLSQRGTEWYIQPAPSVKLLGLNRDRSFEKVKEDDIDIGAIPGLRRLKDKDYKPRPYEVGVVAAIRLDSKGSPQLNKQGNQVGYLKVVARDTPGSQPATLVCSGNMRETENADDDSVVADNTTQRCNHIALAAADDPAKADLIAASTAIRIHPQAVEDYLHALTPFQKVYLHRDEQGMPMGVLQDKRPVFYVEDESGEVRSFGHNPYFRIPALIEETNSAGQTQRRAAVPRDFVPWQMRRPEQIDYADAIFGFIRTDAELKEMKRRGISKPVQGAKARAYASRIFVTDARLARQTENVFLPLLVPRILASPKPTAYPHYLVQTGALQEDLLHYDSQTPDETVIRGHKLYWLQGDVSSEQIQDENVSDESTQHTQMRPVRSGVKFTFRLCFENLSDRELGALCWILCPLGDEEAGRDYCHRLGMGKPYGMGAAQLEATLHLTKRTDRYAALFTGQKWTTGCPRDGERLAEQTDFVREVTGAFEQHILDQLKPFENDQECSRLADLKRIGILLKMMEWPGFPAEYPAKKDKRLQTSSRQPNPRYLTINLPDVAEKKDANEYKDRPVLPDPSDNRFGSLTGDAEPLASVLDDEEHSPVRMSDALNTVGASAAAQGSQEAVSQLAEVESKEIVTIIGTPPVTGIVRVRTNDGREITGTGFYSFFFKRGQECEAIVARKNGEPTEARRVD